MLDIGKRQAFLFRHSVAVPPNSISAVSSFTSLKTAGIVRTIHSERQGSDGRHRSDVGTVAEASAGSGVVFKALWQTQFSLSLGDRAVDQCTSCRIHISRLLEFRGRPAHRSCSVFAWRDPKRSRAGRSSISPPRAGACLDAPDLAGRCHFHRLECSPRIDPDQYRSAFQSYFCDTRQGWAPACRRSMHVGRVFPLDNVDD
jgi:hypothetical protein